MCVGSGASAAAARLDALDRGRVITIFLGQILAGRPVTVVGDGSQTRSIQYGTVLVLLLLVLGICSVGIALRSRLRRKREG